MQGFDEWLDNYGDPGPAEYEPYIAPCGAEVYGTPRDIDSGLRKHIDSCDDCQREQMATEIAETQAAADLDPEWPGHGLE